MLAKISERTTVLTTASKFFHMRKGSGVHDLEEGRGSRISRMPNCIINRNRGGWGVSSTGIGDAGVYQLVQGMLECFDRNR